MNLTDDPRTQSALPLVPPAVRSLLAPWGYPPCRMSLYILRTIANIGNVAAQFTLGWMYEHGDDDNDVAQDYAEAATWYRRAADQGNAPALNTLGWLHFDGHGVPLDHAEAATYFRRAAERGYAAAQYNLAMMYACGCGVAEDHTEAATWCHRAAAQGDVRAQNNLARMHEDGHGVPKDDAAAARWYRRAAAQGLPRAQYNLATMLTAGRGVPQDHAEAAIWFRLAAAQAYQPAQGALDAQPPAPRTDTDVDAILARAELALDRAYHLEAALNARDQQLTAIAAHADRALDEIATTHERLGDVESRLDAHARAREDDYRRLHQTITHLDTTARRATGRIEALLNALDARQERLIATEDRLHRTVIERIGAPHREPEHEAETPPCA